MNALTRKSGIRLSFAAALLFLSAFLSAVLAAEESYRPSLRSDVPFSDHSHRRLVLRDGLPSNWIYDIVQSQNDFIWIATHNGLARYDGLAFRKFNRSNTPELPANDTRVLYESRDGSLWIGTIAGLVKYQAGRPGTFRRMERLAGISIHAIYEDQAGKLWVGTNKQTWVAEEGQAFEVVDDAPARVKAICQDQTGVLWFGSDLGLYQCRGTSTERVDHAALPIPSTSDGGVPPAGVNVLLACQNGDVWIGANAGLLRDKDGSLVDRRQEIGYRQVYDLVQTRTGGLYLASRLGLWRSVDGGECTKLSNEELVTCLMEDREGGLWVGHTGESGLHYYRNAKTQKTLTDVRINCVHEDSEGNVWFGSNSGLHRLRDGESTQFDVKYGLPSALIRTMARRSEGGFWIGTDRGLAKKSSKGFSTVLTPSDLSGLNITSILEDSGNVLWLAIGSRGGFALKDGRLEELAQLAHGRIKWFHEDSMGKLWIGHEHGLFWHNDGEIKQVLHPAFERLNTPHFTCYFRENDETLWIGNAGGIVRYQSGRFDAVTSEDGLAADYVDRILGDNNGNLWFGGRDGFFFVRISQLHQVADGELERVDCHVVESLKGVAGGFQPAGCLAADGTMWMTGHRGVIRVPAEPWPMPISPPIHIERVRVDGNTVQANGPFELMSGSHRLAIDFAAPAFANPRNVHLQYWIDGHDEDRIDAGGERIAYYTDLRPGNYTFHVTATTSGGVALPGEEKLNFTVKPRWWETQTFRALTAICLLALSICSTWRYTRAVRRRNAKLRYEIDERKRVEADRRRAEEKAKDYLLQLERVNRASSLGEMATSIAHEVNQPLFAIVSNAEMAKEFLDNEQPDIQEVRDALTDIIGDGNRAADIVKHVRSLVNKEQPIPMQLDLNRVVLDSLEIIHAEMRRRGVSMRLEIAENLPAVNGSPIELQQVILNFLVNGAQAMRDADEDPKELVLTTCEHDGCVELSVEDRGVGLAPATMDRLFDPFFTTKPQGIGMGLAINRTIIEAHGGSIWAQPNEGRGATFCFRLPAFPESAT